MIQLIPQVQVREAFEKGTRRYPSICLAFETFLERVEEILQGIGNNPAMRKQSPKEWTATFCRLHHEDLFLAVACAMGDRIAWEIFVDDYVPTLRRCAAQACGNPDEGEDLAHEIVAELLGGSSGRDAAGCKLAKYDARGSLGGWLRVVVSHAAIDRHRRSKRQVSFDQLDQQGAVTGAGTGNSDRDAPADRADSRWGLVLSRVLADTIRQLPSRDRLLLSLYYLQDVPLRMIGRQFRVHEATASRWLDRVRNGIRKSVERELRKKHGLKAGDIKPLWYWISEDEGFSLSALLPKTEEKTEGSEKRVQGDLI